MKVSLDTIRIGCGPLTGKIFAGPVKNGVFTHKTDVTSDVISAVLQRCNNKDWHVTNENEKFVIKVEKE